MKLRFWLLRFWTVILGLLLFGMVILSTQSDVLGALAQGGGGSEPGAASTPPPYTGPSKPALSGPAAGPTPTAHWPSQWYTVAGDTFLPSNSGYTYQYGSNGCVRATTPGQWRAPIHVPDGSVLEYIYINYYNEQYSVNSAAYVTKYKYDGSTTDLTSVNSRDYWTTGTGYYFDLSSYFYEVVDNLSYAYVFVWSGYGVAPTPTPSAPQRLCSVQVGYIPVSAFALALPLVAR